MPAGDDLIDISNIDANPLTSADDKFAWLAVGSFGGIAGQLRYFHQQTGREQFVTVIEGDLDGDRKAGFQIEFTGKLDFTPTDFVV